MCGDEGKKASVKLDEIMIYWERKLPLLLETVSSRQRIVYVSMIGEDVENT